MDSWTSCKTSEASTLQGSAAYGLGATDVPAKKIVWEPLVYPIRTFFILSIKVCCLWIVNLLSQEQYSVIPYHTRAGDAEGMHENLDIQIRVLFEMINM
jgi:hypothetical protein